LLKYQYNENFYELDSIVRQNDRQMADQRNPKRCELRLSYTVP